MRKNSRRMPYLVWMLVGMMLILTGCNHDISIVTSSDEFMLPHKPEKVLLSVNQYTEDGYETKTTYDYNEKGQIIRETNSFTYDEETSVEVYDLSYDSAGRLVKKTRSSGDSGWSNEELQRKYDVSGNMVSESSYKYEDAWYEITYTYNSDNHVEKEVSSVDYMGNGSDVDTYEYHHTYSKRSDGTIEDKRKLVKDGEENDEITILYDASGRLVRGYDDYWAAPVRYEYYDDQYFNLYTESEKIDDGDENEEYSFTYAEILDVAGKTVEKISLSDKPEFEYDSEGYLIKATDYYGLTELHYGKIGDKVPEEDNDSAKDTEQKQKAAVKTDSKDLLKKLSGKKFVFSSGAGGWMTEIDMDQDGSFEGYYMDSDLGDTGTDYPNGTTYECSFSGRFVVDQQLDEFTYSAKLKDLKTKEDEGKERIVDGEKRVSAEPYGFETGTNFLFYAPGHPVNTLKPPFLEWINASAGSVLSKGELTVWGLYNVDPEYPMYEDPDTDLVERMKKVQKSEDDQTDQVQGNRSESSNEEELSVPANFKWESDDGGLPDAAGVRVTWDKVPEADGYECRFYLFWGDNDQSTEPDDTGSNYASVYFQDNTNIRVEVRAYRIVDGKKQYSDWGSDVIQEEAVYDL